MKKITIAFDVDGTLRDNTETEVVAANENVRTLLVTLSSFKNTKIIVWSGGGELYARQCVASLGLETYVNGYATKNMTVDPSCSDCKNMKPFGPGHYHFDPGFVPDIAIDDIQDCQLGTLNLIVKEK